MHKHIRKTLCVFFGVLAFQAMPVHAALDMFLCIEGIDGETNNEKNEGCSDVLAWSWGGSQSGTTHAGGGGGTGKSDIQDISITKWSDKSTPELLTLMNNGERTKKVELKVFRSGCMDCGDSPIYRFEFRDGVIVTSVSTGGSGGEDRLTENISLNFPVYEYCYRPTDKDGKVQDEVCSGWDIVNNTQL